jgi:glutathione S-transferase
MTPVELFGVPQSTYFRIAWMTCEEKAAPYVIRQVMPHSPELLDLQPFGRIPAMRHGSLRLFESKAIATYIDRTFDGPRLIPEDPVEQALVEQWVSALNTEIQPAWTKYFQAYVFPKGPGGKPDRAVIEAQVTIIDRHVAMLDRVLGRSSHLAGDRFTLADIVALPILHYLSQFPEGAEKLAGTEHLDPYFRRISERASARATNPPPMGEL